MKRKASDAKIEDTREIFTQKSPMPNLETMPDELLFNMVKNLSPDDFINLSRSSWTMRLRCLRIEDAVFRHFFRTFYHRELPTDSYHTDAKSIFLTEGAKCHWLVEIGGYFGSFYSYRTCLFDSKTQDPTDTIKRFIIYQARQQQWNLKTLAHKTPDFSFSKSNDVLTTLQKVDTSMPFPSNGGRKEWFLAQKQVDQNNHIFSCFYEEEEQKLSILRKNYHFDDDNMRIEDRGRTVIGIIRS